MEVAVALGELQAALNLRIKPLMGELEGNFVDIFHIFRGDDGFFGNTTEQRNLFLYFLGNIVVRAAEQDIGLDTDLSQFFHRVLGGLGLQFSGHADEGNQRQVDKDHVLASLFLAHLADGFEKRQGFDVADRAPDFNDHDIDVVGHLANRRLDFVGDMGNHLNGFAEVVSAPFLGDDSFVDAPRGDSYCRAACACG